MNKRFTTTVVCIILLSMFYSCVSFKKGYKHMETKSSTLNTEELLSKAKLLEENASTSDDIQKIIDAYKEVEKSDPENYFALWKIGNYSLLMGAAHCEKKRDKKKFYRESIKYCEKAMFTNSEYKDEILSGIKVTEAAKKLGINAVDAMGYWYTARFYYFKECLSPIGRVFNTKIVFENNDMIALIDKIDPNWAGGGNYFSRALYYIAVPERFGGDKQKALEEFNKAVEVGPDYFVNRWGRAKYLYSITGNHEGFVSDLQWVVQQDPSKGKNPYAWNVYFQKDAAKMLEKLGVTAK
jgi:tetratricopeptide (TPR) repeat protein